MAARGPCKKCGTRHFLGNPCPTIEVDVEAKQAFEMLKPKAAPLTLRRDNAPEGFFYSPGWGVGTKSVPVVWRLPNRVRMGSLTFPEET